MRSLRLVVLSVLLASVAPLGGATAPATASSRATNDSDDGQSLWLSGPFGRVPGGRLQEPAVGLPGEIELDVFARSAPLTLDGGPAGPIVGPVIVTAFTDSDGNAEMLLSSGDLSFKGPSSSGSWIIVAVIETEDGEGSEHAWRVRVPDHDLPEDGLIDIPAPEALLAGDAGSIAGVPGDGCYVYLCVDVGRPPALASLPTLAVAVAEPLSLTLGDGSALVAWEGSLEPLSDRPEAPVTSAGVITDTVTASVGLVGLEPPTAGDWILTLRVTFDRERGSMEYRYRVVAE